MVFASKGTIKAFLTGLLALVSNYKMTEVNAFGTVVVGLNAAFQKRFVLPVDTSLEPGSVHRAASLEEGIGGKGQDVAIALSCLSSRKENNGDVRLAQFLGKGAEGDKVCDLLLERCGPAKHDLTVRTQAKLRTCTTIVASDTSTELVEPSGLITPDEIADLLDRLASSSSQNVGGLCIMGSMPPGCEEDMYATIHQSVFSATNPSDEEGPLCLVDSVIGLKPLLQKMANHRQSSAKRRGGMFKVNIAELCKLAKVSKLSGGEADRATLEEIQMAVQGFLKEYQSVDVTDALEYIAITDGKFPAHLVKVTPEISNDNFSIWQLGVVSLNKITPDNQQPSMLYPIGAGDTVAAGTLAAWQYLSQRQPENWLDTSVSSALDAYRLEHAEKFDSDDIVAATAFAFGLACGSASCLNQENSVFQTKDAISLLEQMSSPKPIIMEPQH